jgi:DNA-binding CsgD family transcriptional regulator
MSLVGLRCASSSDGISGFWRREVLPFLSEGDTGVGDTAAIGRDVAPLPVLTAFDEVERTRFGDFELLVRAFVEGHFAWREAQHMPAQPLRPGFELREQIRAMHAGDITSRETDIIELMLKGHSAKSMARTLDIEEGTVTNHKRNLYAKLGIHSQAQLFDRFLRTLTMV